MNRYRRDKPPCIPGCPERSGECHATCERYKKWRAGIDEEKKRAGQYLEVKQYTVELIRKIKRRKGEG